MVTGIYESFTSLESLSLISTIWAGFGTLALVPTVQLIRKRQQRIRIEREQENIKKMRTLIQEEIKDVVEKISILDDMIHNLTTDVRILEALDNPSMDSYRDRDKDRKRDRSAFDSIDLKRKIKEDDDSQNG